MRLLTSEELNARGWKAHLLIKERKVSPEYADFAYHMDKLINSADILTNGPKVDENPESWFNTNSSIALYCYDNIKRICESKPHYTHFEGLADEIMQAASKDSERLVNERLNRQIQEMKV